MKGDTEKTQTDRKHERRKKKKGQKLRAKEKERRERTSGSGKPESGGKISKKVAMEKLEKASRMASSKTSIIKVSERFVVFFGGEGEGDDSLLLKMYHIKHN